MSSKPLKGTRESDKQVANGRGLENLTSRQQTAGKGLENLTSR